MTVNTGVISGGIWNPDDQRFVEWRAYYDPAATPVGATQPIINGPNGFAFECDDIGSRFYVNVWQPKTSTWRTVRTPKDGSVTFTAAQLASFGVRTRGDVQIVGPVLG